VCQSPEECYLFSLCTYIFHFPWSGVLDATLKKKCISDLRNVTGFLCALIFFTSHGQVYSIQLHGKKYVSNLRNVTGFLCALIFFTSHDKVYSINLMKQIVSVTCGRWFVFSLYLYFSLPMVRCTR
jgi:hypothetical protein